MSDSDNWTVADDVFLCAINDGEQYPDNVKTAKRLRNARTRTESGAYMLWAGRAFVAIQAYRKEMRRQGETVYLTREDARRVAGKLADYYLNHVAEMDSTPVYDPDHAKKGTPPIVDGTQLRTDSQ